jgi:hypothetical protein
MKSSRRISPGWIGGNNLADLGMGLLMVVHNLDPVSVAVAPHETDTPLIVNPDTVLPGPIAC